jgi:hypothetical protein
MSSELIAASEAEASNLHDSPNRLADQPSLPLHHSETIEDGSEQEGTLTEQGPVFPQIENCHFDELVKAACENRTTRKLMNSVASGLATEVEKREYAGLIYMTKTKGMPQHVETIALAAFQKLQSKEIAEMLENSSSSTSARYDAVVQQTLH